MLWEDDLGEQKMEIPWTPARDGYAKNITKNFKLRRTSKLRRISK